MGLRRYTLSRRTLLTALAGMGGGAAVIGGGAGVLSLSAAPVPARGNATLYKNPQCGCCEGYADHLRLHGFAVKTVPTHDLLSMGQKYGIPGEHSPCHISLIGGYVVGGHVPLEIVDRLLLEKPSIAGINLPGMPVGTPGMPGDRLGPLTIYEIGKDPQKVYALV